MSVAKESWNIVKDTFVRFADNGGSLLGAAIAFYTILSLAPLLLVVVALAGFVLGDEAAKGELVGQLSRYLGHHTAQMVNDLVQHLRHTQLGTNATVVGVVLVLWGATRLFGQLQDALNQLWHVRTDFKNVKATVRVMLYKKLVSFLLLFCVGGLFITFVVGTTVASATKRILGDALPGSDFVWSATPALLGGFLIAAIVTLVFRYLPDAVVAWRDAAAGACVTSSLFVLSEFPLSYYLARQGIETAYGAAGSLVLLLVWVYYSAQIFFLGAQFTVVFAERHGRTLQPDASAVVVSDVPVTDVDKKRATGT